MGFSTDFTGPEGRYTLEIRDYDNLSAIENIELIDEVKIKYGDLERSSARQVLKSYVTLNFVDERLNLHNRLRGGFPLGRFQVEISGPDVKWIGAIKEENRTIPLNNRIRREVTQLRCFGGIESSRFTNPADNALVVVNLSFKLRTQTASVKFGDGCGERLRSDIRLERQNGDDTRVAGVPGSFEHPLNFHINKDPYEGFKNWAKMTKGMMYKSLSENNVIYDSIRLIGNGSGQSPFVGQGENKGTGTPLDPNPAEYESKQRDSFFNKITIDNLITEGESGLEDLPKTGRQVVEIDKDENIIYTGASQKDTNNLAYWRRTDFSGSGLSLGQFWRKSKSKYVVVNVNQDGSGSPETFTIPLGDINPTRAIGLMVEWDAEETNNNPTIRLKYDGNTYEETDTNDTNNEQLIGDPTTNQISPKVEIENGSEGTVAIKVKYIDASQQIVEDLVAQQSNSGTETIEYERPEPPLVSKSSNAVDHTEARKIIYEPVGLDSGFEYLQTYAFRARMERETRPFGTKTLRGKVKGIYGPEYCHILEIDGEETFYVATGLECNLIEGTTKLSLVEVPNHNTLVGPQGTPITY